MHENSEDGPRRKKVKTSHLSADLTKLSTGKLVRVKLINFMCHSNFVFDFEESVNFISGKNGSGKSAIITAVVVGLGGRTTDTKRGPNLKSLIKDGETRAVIEITLSNKGPFGFRQDVYGSEITISRTLTQKGSSYKLLNDRGKVVSTKRAGLSEIILAFNLQPSNPISILNQDTARTFLKDATPKGLYTFFKLGILMDRIEIKLRELESQIVDNHMRLQHAKESCCENARELIEYGKVLEKMKEYDTLHKAFVEKENMLYWAYVKDLEGKLSESKSRLKATEKDLEKEKEISNQREDTQNQLKSRITELEGSHSVAKETLNQCIQQCNENSETKQNSEKRHKEMSSEIFKLEKMIDKDLEAVRDLTEKIDRFQSERNEAKAQREKNEQEKSQLANRITQLRATVSTSVQHRYQLQASVEQLTSRFNADRSQENHLLNAIERKRDHVMKLTNNSNEMNVFSKWMPHIVALIDKAYAEGRFKEKPIGPAGKYIKLKDKLWGPVIESLLGRKFLCSFLVCCKEDQLKVVDIMKRMNIPFSEIPTVLLTRFLPTAYDVSPYEVRHARFQNAYRVLNITNPVVANSVIDMKRLESILLVPDVNDIYPLASKIENVPRNCGRLMAPNGDTFFPQPRYKSYSGNVAPIRFLQTNLEQAKGFIMDELKKLEEQHRRMKEKNGVDEKNLFRMELDLKEWSGKVRDMERQLVLCEKRKNELSMEELPETHNLAVLTDELDYRRGTVESSRKLLKEKQEECSKLRNAVQECGQVLKNAQKHKQLATEELTKLEEALQSAQEEYHSYIRNYNRHSSNLTALQSKIEQWKVKIERTKEELIDATRCATNACPNRPEVEVETTHLSSEVEKMKRFLEPMKSALKDKIEPESFVKRMSEHEAHLRLIQDMNEAMEMASDIRCTTERKAQEVFHQTAALVSQKFQSILKKRNFEAHMDISLEKKTLNLRIKPDLNCEEYAPLCSLSGGERSFSMVAYIIAVWSAMPCPFYFMDEFDVFMDEVNRKMVLGFLLEYAKSQPQKQFLFLTPHGAMDENSFQDFHVYRMADPRPRQS